MRQDITPRGRRLLPAESQVAQVAMYAHDWDEEKHTLVVVGTPDDEVEAALSWVRQHLERFNVIEVPTHSRTPQAMMMYANAHYLGDDHGVTWYPDPHGQLLDAMRQRRGVHVQVANDHNRMVEFFEVHPVTREKSMIARLAAGERQAVEVSLWHSMEAVEEGSAIQLGSKMFADPGTFTARSPSACNYMLNPDTCKPKLPPFPTDPRILASRAADHVERKRMMADQPGQIKFYTKYGFKKRRVPEDVFRFMKTYFELNKLDYETEAWDDSNIYTNQFEANSLMVPIPEGGHHKRKLFAQVQTILEEWSGVALEPTAMYGVRIYPRNCKLEMHCDRPETHIVSAIINVSQDVDEPWPVRVKDHFGEEHDVAMEPGDMVLYEGATCAHGRPDPLNGRYFANVFVHFRPVGYTFRPS